jgi:photosystem II stability/assembly factor-like uncharacterized protein
VEGLSFADPQHGWILLGGPQVTARTSDDRAPAADILDAALPSGRGYAWLAGGGGPWVGLFSTSDGGQSWKQLASFTYTLPTPAP